MVLFKKNSSPEDICFDFRETEREKEREASMVERSKDPSVASPICPDWESNLQPFGVQGDTPTN